MYCQNCATPIEPNAEICTACGARVAEGKTASRALAERVGSSLQDALEAFKVFATNPVGGLPSAFESLDRQRARGVGIAFAMVFMLCTLFGTYMALPTWGKPNMQGIFGLMILGAVAPLSIAGVSGLARKVFSAGGSLDGDAFIAGASLLPVGFVILLTGILGVANIEVVVVVGVFAGCYTILMLYAGCTLISKIPDRKAAVTIPVMLLVSAWLCKIVFAAVL